MCIRLEEKENLKIVFKTNQTLSLEIQQGLSEFISENDAGTWLMFENTTFGKYLNLLQENHEHCLSDRIYNNIENQLLTRANIASMQKSLDEQTMNLLNIKNRLKTLE